MANYKILVESTLGAIGDTVTDADIIAAPADVEQLIVSGIVESVSTTKTPKE